MAVYGRRRVGKTVLIKHVIEKIDGVKFSVTGLKDGKLEQQLKLFYQAFEQTFNPTFKIMPADNWFDTLEILSKAIDLFK